MPDDDEAYHRGRQDGLREGRAEGLAAAVAYFEKALENAKREALLAEHTVERRKG